MATKQSYLEEGAVSPAETATASPDEHMFAINRAFRTQSIDEPIGARIPLAYEEAELPGISGKAMC
ncbi:MAG: hypothetical protein P4M11_03670 [Candidatus Pacebacteria bacterium]|nr:hypothetical protein [Candidatus Paceibacterota bacterium]